MGEPYGSPPLGRGWGGGNMTHITFPLSSPHIGMGSGWVFCNSVVVLNL